ncbi:hypothetical protein SH528x_006009 [Novipirellula sp. SH528]|uniref:hypothetical protein n=1 Tax=Novipirellula sp. SH528 TaxID=3454466 RepID=UPI003FA0683D
MRPIKAGDVAESMELGLRLLLGVLFGCLFAGLGYGIGAILGTVTGIIVATPFAFVGFIYGCFCVEINAMIRLILSSIFER